MKQAITFGLAAMVLLGVAAAPASAPAQGRDPARAGVGPDPFEEGYRRGREDERRAALLRGPWRDEERGRYARRGFPDPWFSYGYEFGERDSWPLPPTGVRPGTRDDQLDLFE